MTLHLNTTQDIGHGVTVMFICFVLVFLAVLIDLYTGIHSAKKHKEKIQSRQIVLFFSSFGEALGYGKFRRE